MATLFQSLGAIVYQGFTTAERDDLNAKERMVLYNTTTEQWEMYLSGDWRAVLILDADGNITAAQHGTLANNLHPEYARTAAPEEITSSWALKSGGSIRTTPGSTPVGEVVIQVKTSSGAPSHSASQGTPCFVAPDDDIYINSTGSTSWTKQAKDSDLDDYVLRDGSVSFTGVVAGVIPTAAAHLATKEYVDSAIHFITDYYFNNTASSYSGIYYKMLDTPTGQGEAPFAVGPLGENDNQALVNFATDAGFPGVTVMEAGHYTGHIHAKVDASNKRPVKIHFKVYARDNGSETLLVISEESDFLTDTSIEYELHGVLAADVMIATTDRLIIKWFANVDSTPANNVTVTLYVEGSTASRMSAPVTTDVLNQVFLRQDGTKELSGNMSVASGVTIDGVDISARDHPQGHTLASHSTKPHSALSDAPADAHADIKVRTKEVDEASIGDGKVMVYRTASGKLEYEAQAGGGGGTHPVDLSSDVTDTLPLGNGGTGATSIKQSFVLYARDGHPSSGGNGCRGPIQQAYGTNDIDLWLLDFHADADTYAWWMWDPPLNWDRGTVTFRYTWLVFNDTTTRGISMWLQGKSWGDGDAIDTAWGAAVEVEDLAQGTINLHLRSAESGAVTIAGSPAVGDTVAFRLMRDVDGYSGSNLDDKTLRIISVRIEFGITGSLSDT